MSFHPKLLPCCSVVGEEIARQIRQVSGEVLPPPGSGDSGVGLTIGEAWALWDLFQSSEPDIRYWEHEHFAGLGERLKTFIRTGPWD